LTLLFVALLPKKVSSDKTKEKEMNGLNGVKKKLSICVRFFLLFPSRLKDENKWDERIECVCERSSGGIDANVVHPAVRCNFFLFATQ
jgi:hypothetical protein